MANKKHVKQKLINAYLDLMYEKAYMDISITELAERAGVSRISFYRNYESFDDLTAEAYEYVSQMVSDFVQPIFNMSDPENICRHVKQMPETLRLLYEKANALVLSNILFISTNYEPTVVKKLQTLSVRERYLYYAQFFTLIAIVSEWARSGKKEEDSKELASITAELMQKIKELR